MADIAAHAIYAKDELNAELRQSEIITGLTQFTFMPDEDVIAVRHTFAIVLSQDCDLKWDYEARKDKKPSDLNGVLVFEAEPWAQVKVAVGGRDIWKPLGQNRNDRYHFLEAVPPDCDLEGEGLAALVVDFKRVFTISASELERQIGLPQDGAKRRCRLLSPYREHLQSRVSFYLQRVGIPEPHQVPAPPKTVAGPADEPAT